MAPKKKSHKPKPNDKKVLYDPFLDRSIELAPSAYEVFRETNKAQPKKTEVVKEEIVEPTSNISTTSKAPKKPKLALKSLEPEKSKALPEPKNDLAQLLYTTEMPKVEKNSQASQPTAAAKSGGLWSTINSDIVWFSIALASILGVLLFYFQGLQPLILNNYTDQSQTKLAELNQSYNNKVSNYISLRTTLTSQVGYNPAGSCADEPLYTGSKTDSSQLDLLRVSLLPDQGLKVLPKYQMFYEQNIVNHYNEAFQSYTDNLNQIRNTSDDLFALPGYLDYRNVWITSCQKIQSSKGDLTELKAVCTELKTRTSQFENKDLSGYPNFKTRIDTGVNKCADIETAKGTIFANFGQWFLDWLNKYSDVMGYKPINNDLTQKLTEQNKQFTSDVKKAGQKINDEYNSRLSFWNIWYLMNF